MMKYLNIICLLILPGVMSAQVITIDTIDISLVLKDKSATYTVTFPLKQNTKGNKYKSSIWPFREVSHHGQIGSVKVDTITADSSYLKSFTLSFKSIPYSGKFLGMVRLISTTPKITDTIDVPVRMRVIHDEDLLVSAADPASLNYVRHKFLSCILPGEFRQKTICIGLENKSLYNTYLDSCTVMLKGTKTLHVITTKNYTIEKPTTMPGNRHGEILLHLKGCLPADEYKGKLIVNKQPGLTSVVVPVSINVRHGVLLPFLVMCLGVGFGLMARSIEGAKEIIALLSTLKTTEDQIKKTDPKTGKDELLIRIGQVREKINNIVPGRDITVISAYVAQLANQGSHIEHLDLFIPSIQSIKNQGLKEEADQLLQKLAKTNLHNPENYATELTAFEKRLKDILSQDQKSQSINEGVVNKVTLPDPPGPESRHTKEISRVEKFKVQTINGIFQPIVFFITVFLALMAGFYEAYVAKELTFGVGGIFDYIKLFVYGAGIVIVTREILNTMLPNISKQLGGK